MSTAADIRSAIEAATVPEDAELERARMIIVDKLGEWDSLGLDELVESVCEAYGAPSGEPLRVADVDPAAPDTDTPALRNLRVARAARTEIIALLDEGTIVAVPREAGTAAVTATATTTTATTTRPPSPRRPRARRPREPGSMRSSSIPARDRGGCGSRSPDPGGRGGQRALMTSGWSVSLRGFCAPPESVDSPNRTSRYRSAWACVMASRAPSLA